VAATQHKKIKFSRRFFFLHQTGTTSLVPKPVMPPGGESSIAGKNKLEKYWVRCVHGS
jgi:hypothetical protein